MFEVTTPAIVAKSSRYWARPSDVVVHHISSSTVQAVDPNPADPGLLG